VDLSRYGLGENFGLMRRALGRKFPLRAALQKPIRKFLREFSEQQRHA